MGQLVYGAHSDSVEIDDRVLAHLKVVMLTKLRRHEGFPFSFDYDARSGGGRTTLWISPTSSLQFRFDGSRQPAINKAWLDILMTSANGVDGLRLMSEPDEPISQVTTETLTVQR